MSGCSVSELSGTGAERTLLTIGLSPSDRARVPRGEDGVPCRVHHVMTRSAALNVLAKHTPAVVICESRLGDGAWSDILTAAFDLSPPPPVIVASRLADEYLWAEVLNLGGYDVLALPLDLHEVNRVVRSAWRVADRRK